MKRRTSWGDNTPAVYCEGKRCINTWKLADTAAKRSDKTKGDRRRPYRCKSCGKWHLGSSYARKHERKWLRGEKWI